ncbi:hypothetical protein AMTRI_Chr02g262100 [Amborella trichopoda]
MVQTLSLTFLFFLLFISTQAQTQHHTFIVHVSKAHKPAIFTTHHHWYKAILRSLRRAGEPKPTLLYSYDRVAHGFSARILPSQADILRNFPEILSVRPERTYSLHTTRTPEFLGLSKDQGLWPNSDYAKDVIIGVLDTGIWPERPSFSDNGLTTVPERWKGVCDSGAGKILSGEFCNGKIIGARWFAKGYEAVNGKINETEESPSPLDTEGHGTHTASTAAGALVSGADFYGYAAGEARGMATNARIAVYKICWKTGCYDSDILAAMDQAVGDGVDVISLSVGSSHLAPEFDDDSIAIGAFGAARHGVVVSCSAGNSGPGPHTATNIAPWILTVGASTIDRDFPADVILGDGTILAGVSLYTGNRSPENFSVVLAADSGDRLCRKGRLIPAKVAGKTVVCERGITARVAKGLSVKDSGGAAMVLINTEESGEELVADAHLLPATMVGQINGDKIRKYVRSANNPSAGILFRGTVTGKYATAAPMVAAFSSRGPNYRSPEILKPDVIAPGVNILAGWTGATGPTGLETDGRRWNFNVISGTSMSCPHVSGLAALLKNAFPHWSPAAVKSALMTTAYDSDNNGSTIKDLADGKESTPFVRGSGHVDPNRALDPGLVYDIKPEDYVAYLCALGYDSVRIAVFTGGKSVDCRVVGFAKSGDLNYPSFSMVFGPGKTVAKFSRTVTNVGDARSAYAASINGPDSVRIRVDPEKLVFGAQNQSLSYSVTFEYVEGYSPLDTCFGLLTWSDGRHDVKSPIAFSWEGALASSF